MLLREIKTNPQACCLDEIPEGKGRFGLDQSNPVPVFGIPSNEVYLKRLSIRGGGSIQWRRVHSIQDSIIEKSIDEYEIFDGNGDAITFIYISPYHLKISNKAPEGFEIR
mgnify:CR=1 FL=1